MKANWTVPTIFLVEPLDVVEGDDWSGVADGRQFELVAVAVLDGNVVDAVHGLVVGIEIGHQHLRKSGTIWSKFIDQCYIQRKIKQHLKFQFRTVHKTIKM